MSIRNVPKQERMSLTAGILRTGTMIPINKGQLYFEKY